MAATKRFWLHFTDFHVAPMCTPTRGQLLTGMDALRNGAIRIPLLSFGRWSTRLMPGHGVPAWLGSQGSLSAKQRIDELVAECFPP